MNTPPRFRRAPAPASMSADARNKATTAPKADGTVRLNKHMADLGLASRREADDWIANGWVRVDGQVAPMGLQVAPGVRIDIDPAAKGQQARQVTVLLNKPLGVVSGQAEDGHTPAITLVQPGNRWRQDRTRIQFHPAQLRSLVPAGRLDIDSTGLLVLTQDGRVARQIIGEDAELEKEYLVRVTYTGAPNLAAASSAAATHSKLQVLDENSPATQDVQSVFPTSELAKLRHGLSLDGQALKPAKVDWQNPQQLRFVLTEGKKRQIRRMCELVGLKVLALKRVRVGRVRLGDLPVGQWRYLGADESFSG